MVEEVIGIPRALHYYYYYPGWQEFFTSLDCQLVVSPLTNKIILENGVRKSVEDLCLPFKSYFGHVQELIDRVDYLFIPRLLSLGRNNKVCPKFMGLPDMVRAIYPDCDLPDIIDPVFDLKNGIISLRSFAHRTGDQLGKNWLKTEWAFWKGFKKQLCFDRYRTRHVTATDCQFQPDSEPDLPAKDEYRLTLAVLGHSYLIYDPFLSRGLLQKLTEMKIRVITQDMIKKNLLEEGADQQPKRLFWYFNRQILGAAYHFFTAREKVDGIILVDAFACGPDALVKEIIKLKGELPILNLNLDEHSGEAGLETRLEAFIDLLERRYYRWQTG